MKKFYTLFILAFVAIAVNAQVSIKNPGILTGKQNLELNLTPIAREANVAQDQSSRRAGTLVTPPSGKEQLSYTLDGVYNNYSSSAGGFVQVSDAAPAEAKVVFDGNTVYVQGISYWFPEGWIKGTLKGTVVTFNDGQFVGADSYGDNYINGFNGAACNITFDYDSSTGVLTLSSDCYVMESSQPKAGGNCWSYWESIVLTPGEAETPEVVTPPSGLTPEVWTLTAITPDESEESESSDDEEVKYTDVTWPVALGFDGNDVYLMCANPFIPEAWVKGTRSGKTITFATGQYFGAYEPEESDGSYPMYLLGYASSGISDIVFTMNDTEDELATSNLVVINAKKSIISPYVFFADVVLTKQTSGIAPVKVEKADGAIYSIDGRRLNEAPTKGLYIQNGKKYIAK